ncbi:unnamed protein product [Rotaria sp. Silwood2]|nr:unnamed protein product [Rotaria sp. Silwood2]CAF3096712.1 unnamed protein product [Rotaria sp. Silwood2]CAF4091346.1 unnamed protein product [Rotaria sp. Silwood2]CAF4163214.1 unnamed protein product [Rotaria sp. Silwood2]CAF4469205.1 unnamed protein product [Rotaria sp. Silwood2]
MMKRLSDVNIETLETYEYQLDINIRKKNRLNGRFYEADWIPIREPPIILMTMNKETAEHKASWYLMLNSHKHILHTFGFVGNNEQLSMLLQERAIRGNLQKLLQDKCFQPSTKVLITIFFQVLDAIIYIGTQGIIVDNLCCSNVLVFRMNSTKSSENLVKLTNFSMARKKDSSYVDNRPTTIPIRYCAPEILNSIDQSNYSEAFDVYSFGVLLWEACSHGKIPYGSNTSDSNVRQRRLDGEELLQPNECNNQIWSIIQCCLYRTPEIRDTMENIQSKFLKIDLE